MPYKRPIDFNDDYLQHPPQYHTANMPEHAQGKDITNIVIGALVVAITAAALILKHVVDTGTWF